MPDPLDDVLRLVAEGRLSPDEAAPIIDALAAVPSPTVTVTCQDRNLNPVATCRTDYFLSVQVSSQVSMFTPVIAGLVGTNTYSATSKVTVNQ